VRQADNDMPRRAESTALASGTGNLARASGGISESNAAAMGTCRPAPRSGGFQAAGPRRDWGDRRASLITLTASTVDGATRTTPPRRDADRPSQHESPSAPRGGFFYLLHDFPACAVICITLSDLFT
jgi:hypothetical protein